MIVNESGGARSLFSENIDADLVIVGGGVSGVCCAITAAREGLKVALVQDRPVLGGNASSEVRLWILGATSHMGNNNRWSREGGVIGELLIENTYRNPQGNPIIFDAILLEKVVEEKNIRLFLNTAIFETKMEENSRIRLVRGYCSQNQTEYRFHAPYFCDASGDGVIAFLSGAAFRMGAESREEFGEKFAPSQEYGELLGHSLYFYSKDTGQPVNFTAPSFALTDITNIPRYKTFNLEDQGCKLWWIEYGGRLDTVKDTEQIKWELWKVVYGVWNYIKNSGEFPEAANYTLEWVGTIPGKRESRRFMGDYMLVQQDIVEQRKHEDAVSYGGWAIDLHPADGVFSELPGCNQWHSKGIYTIPFRCLYSKNISNLFLAGRVVSASHVAFGSSRVMATSANSAQAVAMAAVIAQKNNIFPRQVLDHITELQQQLLKAGQFIPGIANEDPSDLAMKARLTASSEFQLKELPQSGEMYPLTDAGFAQMVPVSSGKVPEMYFYLFSDEKTDLPVQLAISSRKGNFTPDTILEEQIISLIKGKNHVKLKWNAKVRENQYVYLILRKHASVSAYISDIRLTGILSLFQAVNKAVSNTGVQTPPEDIGIEAFELWTPKRRPCGHNLAISFSDPVYSYKADYVKNGIARPYLAPNAWAASLEDRDPKLTLKWDKPVSIQQIQLSFDTDFDHPMESVLMHHPDNVMPFCVRNYTVYEGTGRILKKVAGNYQTRNSITLQEPVITDTLVIECEHPSIHIPAAIFEIRCY